MHGRHDPLPMWSEQTGALNRYIGLLVRSLLWLVEFLLAGGGNAYMYHFRKPEVSTLDFLAGGPFLYLQPDKYVLPHKVTTRLRMFAAGLCLFIITLVVGLAVIG